MSQAIASNPLILRRLEAGDEAAFYRGLADWEREERSWYTFDYEDGMPFADLLAILKRKEEGRGLEAGRVPATMLYGFVGPDIVGRVSIRHVLNDYLLARGGHIGWSVAPRFRRRGYARAMVEQSLPVLRQLNLSRILITCSNSNGASQRLIAGLGGVLENEVPVEGDVVQRYWVELSRLLA